MNRIEQSRKRTSDLTIPSPAGLEYMPFQKAGIDFLIRNPYINGLIADQPGLGKTIQAIGFANYTGFVNLGIICPASMVLKWAEEIKKWHVGNPKIQTILSGNQELDKKVDVHITSFNLAINTGIHKFFQRKRPDVLIIDEVHYLKNWKAKRTRGIYGEKLLTDKSKYVLALSGTPVVNRPIEIYETINALCPEAINYMNEETFSIKYCEGHWRDREFWNLGASNMKELGERLRSTFMVRRLKKDVLTDLPPKIQDIVYIDPDRNAKRLIKEMSRFESDEILKLRGVTSSFEGLSEMRRDLGLAKVPAAIELSMDRLQTREKIILFAHHKDVIKELESEFAAKGIKTCKIIGGMPAKKKASVEFEFMHDLSVRVFLGSIGACGVGLTLTAADYCLLVEPSWVPGENEQAIDRIHRITQLKHVLADFLFFPRSLDENILKSQTKKARDITQIMD